MSEERLALLNYIRDEANKIRETGQGYLIDVIAKLYIDESVPPNYINNENNATS